MNVPDIIIAVDGLSSTGKSSFSRQLASRFGFVYLDSGALYRGVTLLAREENLISRLNVVSPMLEKRLAEGADFHFESNGLHLGDRNIEKHIRSLEVSGQVSPVAAQQYVRNFVDNILHKLSENGRVVMDGRDIGTTVFPDAGLKIFMVAREDVRARRRYMEMLSKGEQPSFDDVVSNLRERDHIDSTRAVSPLRCPQDAFVLDNSDMSIEEEICWVRGVIQGKFGLLDW